MEAWVGKGSPQRPGHWQQMVLKGPPWRKPSLSSPLTLQPRAGSPQAKKLKRREQQPHLSADNWIKAVLGKEKAVALHSSTLAWKIPWTEEPGRLQSIGSLRVGHD